HSRVTLHRAAHVAEQHKRSWTDRSHPAFEHDDVAARAQAVADGTAQIDFRSAAADPSTRPALAGVPDETRERQTRFGDFAGGERGEVFRGEPTSVAPCPDGVFEGWRLFIGAVAWTDVTHDFA